MKCEISGTGQSEEREGASSVLRVQHRQSQHHAREENRNSCVPSAFSGSVRVPAAELLRCKSRDIWQRGQHGYSQIALPGKPLQDGREPEGQPVASRGGEKIAQGQQQYVFVPDCFPDRIAAQLLLAAILLFKFSFNPFTLLWRKPPGLTRPIRQVKERNRAGDDRWNSLEDEEPPPAVQSEPGNSEKESSQGRTDDERERVRRVKACGGPGSVRSAKPVRDVYDDRWKEARFRRSHQEPHHEKFLRRVNEC